MSKYSAQATGNCCCVTSGCGAHDDLTLSERPYLGHGDSSLNQPKYSGVKTTESDNKIKRILLLNFGFLTKPTNKQIILSSGLFSSSSVSFGSVRVLSSISSGSITAGPNPYRALWEFQKYSCARFFRTTDF